MPSSLLKDKLAYDSISAERTAGNELTAQRELDAVKKTDT